MSKDKQTIERVILDWQGAYEINGNGHFIDLASAIKDFIGRSDVSH